MQLQVVLTGNNVHETFTLNIPREETIHTLKKYIHAHTGIAESLQKIIYAGEVIKENETVSKFMQDTTVHVRVNSTEEPIRTQPQVEAVPAVSEVEAEMPQEIALVKPQKIEQGIPQEIQDPSDNVTNWKYLSAMVSSVIKKYFGVFETENMEWRCNEHYEIVDVIRNSNGANNVGIFRIKLIKSIPEIDAPNLVLKIVKGAVNTRDKERRAQMYRTPYIRKRDNSETTIPFIYAFPTFVPVYNYYISNINDLLHSAIAKEYIESFRNECLPDEKIVSKTTFIVTPYYDSTLCTLWKTNLHTISEEDQYFIIYQIILTLKHFNKNCIVHGDLRGDNIFIFTNAEDKKNYLRIGVGDFGLALSGAHKIASAKEIRSHKEHKTNKLYIPPELEKLYLPAGKEVNLWQCFSGLDSFSCGKSIEELYKLRDGVIPHGLKYTCKSLLDKDKDKRNIAECIFYLGVENWIVPIIREVLGDSLDIRPKRYIEEQPAQTINSAEYSEIENRLRSLHMELQQKLNDPSTLTWKEVCEIKWFAREFPFVHLDKMLHYLGICLHPGSSPSICACVEEAEVSSSLSLEIGTALRSVGADLKSFKSIHNVAWLTIFNYIKSDVNNENGGDCNEQQLFFVPTDSFQIKSILEETIDHNCCTDDWSGKGFYFTNNIRLVERLSQKQGTKQRVVFYSRVILGKCKIVDEQEKINHRADLEGFHSVERKGKEGSEFVVFRIGQAIPFVKIVFETK